MSTTPEAARRVLHTADCLHNELAVQTAYDRLAQAIAHEYEGRNPLLLCVMIGGLHATAEISRRLAFPLEIDYLHATRYRGATTGSGLAWLHRPATPLEVVSPSYPAALRDFGKGFEVFLAGLFGGFALVAAFSSAASVPAESRITDTGTPL